MRQINKLVALSNIVEAVLRSNPIPCRLLGASSLRELDAILHLGVLGRLWSSVCDATRRRDHNVGRELALLHRLHAHPLGTLLGGHTVLSHLLLGGLRLVAGIESSFISLHQ